MTFDRDTRIAYLAMAACMLGGWSLRFVSEMRPISGANVYTFAFYATFVLVWMRLTQRRFLHRTVLACLTSVGMLMVTWLFIRTVKYDLVTIDSTVTRYLWYLYYVPFIFIPTAFFTAVLHVGKRGEEHISRRWYLLYAMSAALLLLVMTNDLHMLAFVFPDGLAQWDEVHYTRGPVYTATYVWFIGLAVMCIVVAFVRSAQRLSIRRLLILAIPLALGVAYSYLFITAPRSLIPQVSKLPETLCFLTAFFLECLIRLGLFPANEGYGELWRESSLRGGLMGYDGTVAFASSGVPCVTSGQVSAAVTKLVNLDDHTVLAAKEVTGGTAYWVRDLTEVQALKEELEGLGNVLAEENAMLAAERDLAREREVLAQRELLHQQVMTSIAPQLNALEDMLADVPADDEAFLAHMHHAAVEAAFAKRGANLILVGEGGSVDARELTLALAEPAEWLKSCGIVVELPQVREGMMPTQEALDAYHAFMTEALGADAP